MWFFLERIPIWVISVRRPIEIVCQYSGVVVKKAVLIAAGIAAGSVVYDLIRHGGHQIDYVRAAVQGIIAFLFLALLRRK